jgi:hypothetical protein
MEINFLWIGDTLNKMCQLTLKSFLDFDHKVILWSYSKNIKNLPSGVLIKNANDILEESKIFVYQGNGDCRLGSYGGYSDIFRYYLLQKTGGWYCDMDVTCLDNFSKIPNQEYVIRPHNICEYVGNIIKTPQNAPFLKECIELSEEKVNKNNNDWVLPVKILSDSIKKYHLEQFVISKDYFGEDHIQDLTLYLSIPYQNKKPLPKYAIHWCNEAVSHGLWNKEMKRNWDVPIPTTLYYKLLKKHNLL